MRKAARNEPVPPWQKVITYADGLTGGTGAKANPEAAGIAAQKFQMKVSKKQDGGVYEQAPPSFGFTSG
jgi:hypothetical protein